MNIKYIVKVINTGLSLPTFDFEEGTICLMSGEFCRFLREGEGGGSPKSIHERPLCYIVCNVFVLVFMAVCVLVCRLLVIGICICGCICPTCDCCDCCDRLNGIIGGNLIGGSGNTVSGENHVSKPFSIDSTQRSDFCEPVHTTSFVENIFKL